MSEPVRPALSRARAYLETLLDSVEARDGRLLPGVRVLAGRAGVSRETMRRAALQCAREGKLDMCHGSGIRVPRPSAPAPLSDKPRERWRAVASRLRASVLRGTVGAKGVLPSAKELRLTLGVSHHTVGRAMRHLCEEGLVVRHGRGYRSAFHTAAPPGHALVLITGGDRWGRLRFPHPRSLTNLQFLQSACAVHNLELHIVVVTPSGDRLSYPTGDTTVLGPSAGHVLGHVVWIATGPDQLLPAVREHLSARDLPVAVVDESAEQTATVSSLRRARWFRPTLGFGAGREVGQMLLGDGHRRVSFLLSTPETPLMLQRLDGVRAAYRDAGLDGAVQVIRGEAQRATSLAGMRGAALAAVRSVRTDTFLGWALKTLVTSHPDDLGHLLHDDLIREAFEPSLVQAFAHGDATAWVAETDRVALAAQAVVDSRHDRARRVAVVGFDNSTAALTHGLTSYDFNGRACAEAAVNYVLHPAQFRHQPNPAGIDGSVVRRRSSRLAGP